MMDWRGVCKWKKNKFDPRSTEKICAYAHGKFSVVKFTIDAEIFAAMETMNSLKIHFLDKEEITLRTDCQVIISFHNKSVRNKPSRVRWIAFTDFITETGVKVNFEHIDDKLNLFIDTLSRLVEEPVIIAALTDAEDEALASAQYPLLTKYEDLLHETSKNIFFKEEHDKRKELAGMPSKELDL